MTPLSAATSARRLRILYLHQYFNTPEMAGGTRSYEMARRLVSYGHDVEMITADCAAPAGAPTWRESDEAGIRVHWTPVAYDNTRGFGSRMKAFLDFAGRSARRARAIGGDVVFATSTPLTIALPGVRAAHRLEVPMVLEVRDLWPKVPIELGVLKSPATKWAAEELERYAYRNAAQVVALAPGMKEWVVSRGYPERDVTVVPNGCDRELFSDARARGLALRKTLTWLGDRPLVLYAGTMGLVNGVDYMVRLAEETALLDPDIQFVAVGSGREAGAVRDLARECGVLDRTFRIIPSVPKATMPAWLGAATVALSLIVNERYLWENAVTNKFFDALAAGVPILSNHPGWQTEIALEADAGLMLDPVDIRKAASVLVAAVRDEKWRLRASQAEAALAAGRFDRDTVARTLEGVLIEAVEAGPRGAGLGAPSSYDPR